MITVVRGDILKAYVTALVNPVNCVGVMGRGLALQFKKAFVNNFSAYAGVCKRGELSVGTLHTYQCAGFTIPRYIVNFPTKNHWRDKSKLGDIESGLRVLVKEVKRLSFSSIALPPLGCGLGGLKWSKVRPLIEKELFVIPDVHVLLYEPLEKED